MEIQEQVVLEEIDKLLIQKAHPREYKLKVLDLWPAGQKNYLDVRPWVTGYHRPQARLEQWQAILRQK